MTVCPTCGETENISGTPVDLDIQITCGTCTTTWLRGDPRCKGCGAAGGIPHRQVMIRTPRGNQVAVVGHREIVLCPTCDAEALRDATSALVPQDYVSVFLFGVAPPPRTSVPAPAPIATERPPARRDAAASRAGQRTVATGENRATAKPTVTPAPLVEPTARQAIEAYLVAEPEGDSLVMLMLGRHLGPSRRVRDLDTPAEQHRLRTWFAQTWSARDPGRRDAARDAILAALSHWRAHGWIEHDTLLQLD